MVNIDAKVKDSNGDICRVECVYDDEILVSYGGSHAEDTDFLKHGTYTVIEDVRSELEQQKQRADYLEKYIKIMRDNYSEINKDAQTILRTAPDDVLLKARIRWNNDVIKILDKILENDNA